MKDRLEIDYFIYYMMPTNFPADKLPGYVNILESSCRNWEREIITFSTRRSNRHDILFEWYAFYRDDDRNTRVGGHTEQEAIRNLKNRYETRNSD